MYFREFTFPGTWVNRALESMSVTLRLFGENTLSQQSLVVLLGSCHNAFPRCTTRAEGSNGCTVLAAQYEDVGVRLVDEVVPWQLDAFAHVFARLPDFDRCSMSGLPSSGTSFEGSKAFLSCPLAASPPQEASQCWPPW